MAITIRLAKRGEEEAIFRVNRTVWLSTYPNKKLGITKKAIEEQFKQKKKNLKKIFQTRESHVWVAVDGSKIIGICWTRIVDGVNYLGATYILPKYQGQGIGKRFIQKVCLWFGEGAEIKTDVANYNIDTIKFYEKQGFVKTGKIRRPKETRMPNGSVIPIFEMTKKV